MRVMGIDPGIERTGFAIVELSSGEPRVLDCGRITSDRRTPLASRLHNLAQELSALLRQWQPHAAGIEQIFFSKNVKTALTVSHARGVILEVLGREGIPVQEFNPSHVKLAVTGSARADKIQVKKMITYITGLRITSDDAADAVACALCVRSL